MRARVLVRPKAGILDPQGQAVERALPALGFTGVSRVHIGRLIELDVEDPQRLPEMCERLLSNPLIEGYEVWDRAVPGLVRRRGCSAGGGTRGRWRAAVARGSGSAGRGCCDRAGGILV